MIYRFTIIIMTNQLTFKIIKIILITKLQHN